MAGTRTVYRGAKGRFAGASVGKPEKVRAGGFANAAFQQRFQAMRAANKTNARPSGTRRQPFPLKNRARDKKALRMAGLVAPAVVLGGGAGLLAGGTAGRLMAGVKMSPTTRLLGTAAMVAGAAGVQHNVKVGLKRTARAKSSGGRKIRR